MPFLALSLAAWLTLGAILVVGGIVSWTWQRKQDQQLVARATAHMAGRPRRSAEEFGHAVYAVDLRDVAARVIRVLDGIVDVDLSQAAPTDGIETDLKLASVDSLFFLELVLRLEKEFDVKFDRRVFDEVRSVDDLVRAVATAAQSAKQDAGRRSFGRGRR